MTRCVSCMAVVDTESLCGHPIQRLSAWTLSSSSLNDMLLSIILKLTHPSVDLQHTLPPAIKMSSTPLVDKVLSLSLAIILILSPSHVLLRT